MKATTQASHETQLAKVRNELREARQQLQLGAIANVRRPKILRRQIARLLTQKRATELNKTKGGQKA